MAVKSRRNWLRSVIPAKAGIQDWPTLVPRALDPRFSGADDILLFKSQG
jgi:hypothetical protein